MKPRSFLKVAQALHAVAVPAPTHSLHPVEEFWGSFQGCDPCLNMWLPVTPNCVLGDLPRWTGGGGRRHGIDREGIGGPQKCGDVISQCEHGAEVVCLENGILFNRCRTLQSETVNIR